MSVKQERVLRATGLAALASACTGMVTTVELRNEGFVTGKVVQSDGYMNVLMADVTLTDPSGRTLKFSSFFVQSRLIRYIQIPPSMDIRTAIQQTVDQTAPGRGRGRGRGRNEFQISKHRQKILAKKEARRQEDIRNALAMKKEQEEKKTRP